MVFTYYKYCIFFSGLRDQGSSNNCRDIDSLLGKLESALPDKYAKDVFCAQNVLTKALEDDSTCPGDSGKAIKTYFQIILLVWLKIIVI